MEQLFVYVYAEPAGLNHIIDLEGRARNLPQRYINYCLENRKKVAPGAVQLTVKILANNNIHI